MNKHIMFLLLALLCSAALNVFAARPNVILIMTDDQGYGDLGCHGNPALKTPNLDRLHAESVRLTDFHVSPESVSPRMTPVSIDLGNPTENRAVLCSQDWYMPKGNPPWHFGHINQFVRVTGPWMVNIRKAGRYRLILRQWPALANRPVVAVRAKVRVAGQEMESKVEPGTKGVVFEMDLPAGKTELQTWLFDEKGEAGGAYFTEVEAL